MSRGTIRLGVEKQKSRGDTRVYWGIAMTLGVIGITTFTEDEEPFPGEKPPGIYLFIDRLPKMLDKMLGRNTPKPRTIFSDRGPGFYYPNSGTITGEYDTILRKHNFQAWAGTNSKEGPRAQPPDIPDVFLHETAVSWVRQRLYVTAPQRRWEETPEQLAARLQAAADFCNDEYNVSGLCRKFTGRLTQLVKETRGDRLPY